MKKGQKVKKHRVICQKWEESEGGWGTRPDGYSLHLNETHREMFIKEYWAGKPKETPDEYSRPDGEPYKCMVDEKTYKRIKASKYGLRFSGTPPGSGGKTGWVTVGQKSKR